MTTLEREKKQVELCERGVRLAKARLDLAKIALAKARLDLITWKDIFVMAPTSAGARKIINEELGIVQQTFGG